MIRREDYPSWVITPMVISVVATFICVIATMFLGRYGVKGLYAEFLNGILAINLGVMMLSVTIMFLISFRRKISSGSVAFKDYFIGFLVFLRSILLILVLFLFLSVSYHIGQSKNELSFYVISSWVIAIAIFIAYVVYCRRHKSMQGKVISLIFCVIVFPVIICLGFYLGTKTIYNTTSDIISRKTCDVILDNAKVTKNTQSKGGTTYNLVGYDLNNKLTTFRITSETYNDISNNHYERIKVVCYEKSRVIDDIYVKR